MKTPDSTAGGSDLPERGNCFDRRCPSRAVLAHVTGRWGSLIIAAIGAAGTLRFSQVRARVDGISERMLAQSLRELERDGLLHRTSRPVVPPHVDYTLTPLGSGVAERVAKLVSYIERHAAQAVAAQRLHDAGAMHVSPAPPDLPPAGRMVTQRRSSKRAV